MARPRTDIRERILHAARAQFLRHGVDGASMRAIAQEATTSLGMITYYFESKDALFLAVVEEAYSGVLADIRSIVESAASFQSALGQLLARVHRASDLEHDVMRILFREGLVSGPRLTQVVRRFSAGHLPILFKLFADAQDAQLLRRDIPLPVLMISFGSQVILPALLRRQVAEIGVASPFLPDAMLLAEGTLRVFLEGAQSPTTGR